MAWAEGWGLGEDSVRVWSSKAGFLPRPRSFSGLLIVNGGATVEG